MKKGGWFLLMVCVCALCAILGLFIGRNMNGHYVMLPVNQQQSNENAETIQTDFRIDINTATQRQLMELPGIGETMAKRIIDYRTEHGPFYSTDDLIHVEGIGEKTLQAIESFIKVGG